MRLDGLEVLQEIIRINPQAHCIILSRIDEDMVKERALDIGAKKYIEKPLEPDELIGAIEQIAENISV